MVDTVKEIDEQFRRDARRQGLSDGYYGYPANPGDFDKDCAAIYVRAHSEGRLKNHGGKAW